jgi:hypothetical protein
VKVKRAGRGTSLAVLLAWVTLLGLAACLPGQAQGKVKHPTPASARVVAVVFTGVGAASGEITVSYPARVTRQQAEQDLAAMQSVTGWRFAAPRLTESRGETQASAGMTPGPVASGGRGEPVWPVVWGLRRYSRVAVALVGDTYAGPPGQLDNAYVHAVWGGGSGLTSYDVTIRDGSFTSLEQLQQRPGGREKAAPGQAAAAGGPRSVPLWAFAVLALALAAGVYLLAARGLQRRDASDRQQAQVSRAWRARRARNMYKSTHRRTPLT